MSRELFNLARALIDIPSPSGEEGDLTDFLSSQLRDEGFACREQPVEGRRRNLFAALSPKPRVVLCTHQDTVLPFYPATEDADFLYGRGACDAKGALACMVQAARRLRQAGVCSLGLLFVVGEETDSLGAQRARDLAVGSEFIVVGEPTENKLASAHKGFLHLRLTVRGRAAHSGFPQMGKSAIHSLLDGLEKLRSLPLDENPVLGPATLNIGKIDGGQAPNIIADLAQAEVGIRLVQSSESMLAAVGRALDPGVEVQVISRSEPQSLHTLPGFEHVVVPFGSDIPYLRDFGKPLLLGPGSILTAHADDERVSKKDLEEAVGLYMRIVADLLSKE